jgi:hypothetical protein
MVFVSETKCARRASHYVCGRVSVDVVAGYVFPCYVFPCAKNSVDLVIVCVGLQDRETQCRDIGSYCQRKTTTANM